MKLENLLETVKDKCLETSVKLSNNPIYKYCVDVTSGWAYYTPTYALQEAIAGKDLETIVKTRLLGMLVHSIVMRPVGLLRNYVAKKWSVTENSSFWDKTKVNLVSVTPIQSIAYAGMLIGGMAWSGNYDWKASGIAWGIGVGVGALHSIPYGFVQDKFRKFFKVKPAIQKDETQTETQTETKIGYTKKETNKTYKKYL
ncbi:MAG: L-alanine exporter AlaE [Nanoarchaeota archaeon]|nr:L-alanine exporter AlaE [Nanoarchaeota archaeon]MBU1030117.1 L-alanine exporter AlaE [Nanoarchaeota archaeon]MBU1850000.1 L-alanine exporter AlaE [Nanoarchaeota archaeon]